MRRDPGRDSCPDFPRLMSGLSILKLSARLCSLGLNPDATRPMERLMSRLSSSYVQTQIFGATMQFGSESGCGATMADKARLSRPRRRMPDFPDQWGDGATFQTIWRRRGFPDQGRDGTTFQTMAGSGEFIRSGLRGAWRMRRVPLCTILRYPFLADWP